MDRQLAVVAASYDAAIEGGRRGDDGPSPYEDLPDYITSDPDYPAYATGIGVSASANDDIREALAPAAGMKFLGLGCALNLMFNGHDQWPSTYYGVDISAQTIDLLHEFAVQKQLPIGSLHCGSIHDMPFDDGAFDIAACIGVLEYFAADFVRAAMVEIRRVLKPGGLLAVEIPHIGSGVCRVAKMVEAHIGRPGLFNLSQQDFETIASESFAVEKKYVAPNSEAVLYILRAK